MFPFSNPEFQLELHHQRAAELHREAAAYRAARALSSAARHARSGQRSRGAHQARTVRAPAAG